MSLRFSPLLIALSLVVPLGASTAGCGESHTTGDDAGTGITFDADVPGDGSGPRPDGGPPMPECGNGRQEATEECDDGNTMAGDGCDASCDREAYCGDGVEDAGEACDDGNNRSADGCRSDCGSDETCGNMIVDYAVGEVCDGTPGCDPMTCAMIMGCGDGMVAAGEECDNDVGTPPARWDGCGADCREEITLAMQMLAIGGMGTGCDYSGDGRADNGFARALGPIAPFLDMFLGGGGMGGAPPILMSFMGLDDPAGLNDDSLRVAWLVGQETAPGEYLVNDSSLNPDGSPQTSIESSIMSRMLDGGPEDIELPIMFLPLELKQGRIRGTTQATAGELSGLSDGLLCGVVPPRVLSFISTDLLGMFGGGGMPIVEVGDPCDPATESSNMADMLIGGATLTVNLMGRPFPITLRATSPDVDVDGDGLESFEVVRTGAMGCQPVISACIDGDGVTRIEGHDCVLDDRIQDGWSAAFTFTAERASIVGVGTGGMAGGGMAGGGG